MRTNLATFAIAVSLLGLATGCSGDAQQTTSGHDDGHNHAAEGHPTEGPHHGELIELGNEEYHAELLHDDSSVTIYILDSGAAKQTPIDAGELMVNLTHDGKPEQFKLLADPDAGDPEGKSSRFLLKDETLAHAIDEPGAEPKLVVTIAGKSYRGEMAHDHEGHAGHQH
ncbi:MAG: hypothetical protein KDB14_08105 [Planctomycetales bacterium]|nr:hypothetical protein [Planctomycetales bacterium]